MNVSISLLVSNPCWFSEVLPAYRSIPTKNILLGSCLSSTHAVMVLQVTSYNHSALIVLLNHQFQSSNLHGVVHSEPYHFYVTHDFVYPLYSIDLGEWHVHSCQSSFWSRSLTPMEVVSIGMGIEKVLLHREHPMKPLDKENWVMNATWSESTTFSAIHAWKEKWHGDWEVFLHSTVSKSSVLHSKCALHCLLVLPLLS
jgi:hypothetical protein